MNLNTQHTYDMSDHCFPQVKMKYGWNFSVSGLKIMVKSGLEEIFLKFLHVLAIELVSMELNHLAAILHVYAGDLNFMK